MTIVYILFFGILNFLIYYFLVKKIKLDSKILNLIIAFLMIFILTQNFYLNKYFLTDNEFRNFIIMSLFIIMVHYSMKFTVIKTRGDDFENLSFSDKLSDDFFNFFRLKVIYLFIYFSQIYFLIIL